MGIDFCIRGIGLNNLFPAPLVKSALSAERKLEKCGSLFSEYWLPRGNVACDVTAEINGSEGGFHITCISWRLRDSLPLFSMALNDLNKVGDEDPLFFEMIFLEGDRLQDYVARLHSLVEINWDYFENQCYSKKGHIPALTKQEAKVLLHLLESVCGYATFSAS